MGTLLGLIIAAIVAGCVYSDALKRGMSAGWWAIGVFLFMIIFLPIYLIVRKPIK